MPYFLVYQPVILAIAFFVVGGTWVCGRSTSYCYRRQGRLSNPAVRRSSTE